MANSAIVCANIWCIQSAPSADDMSRAAGAAVRVAMGPPGAIDVGFGHALHADLAISSLATAVGASVPVDEWWVTDIDLVLSP